MDLYLLLFCLVIGNYMYGDSLQGSKSSLSPQVQQWEKVFMPRTKHNIAFFTGSSSGSWESKHPELPTNSTDFIFSYRYYLADLDRVSFFLGTNIGYSFDLENRFSGYKGSKFMLPGLVAGFSYFFSIKLRAALAANLSLTRYTKLTLNKKNYRLASENLRDFFLSFEYFFAQNWGVITCLNYRGELFLDDKVSFRNDVRTSWSLMAGLTYHKL